MSTLTNNPVSPLLESQTPAVKLFSSIKHLLGLDRAIAFTVLARGTQILASTGTVLLILRFLSPVEQGYYYTLLSLVSLQTVFELGFSFVILQMAAHECAHLTLHPDGGIEGDAIAQARLASILQKTLRWYLVASGILCVSLLPVGAYFFSRHSHVSAPVDWYGPWTVAVFATAFLFFLNPFFSFLEGCGQIWQVGRMRFTQAILGAALSWGALLAHRGLYAPGMVNFGFAAAGLAFLYGRRNLCLGLLRRPASEQSVSWRSEIWPFQWKIAVSWICAYVSIQFFTPVLFAYRGAAEAGQFGMSLSITGHMWALALAWMSTKATPFGQMIARREFERLDQLFFRTLWQALGLLAIMAVCCELGLISAGKLAPHLAARFVSPVVFSVLLITAFAMFVVQAFAVYLRAHKDEPFLIQSSVVAMLTILGALWCATRWGMWSAAITYFLSTGVIGLSYATAIFHLKRRAHRTCYG